MRSVASALNSIQSAWNDASAARPLILRQEGEHIVGGQSQHGLREPSPIVKELNSKSSRPETRPRSVQPIELSGVPSPPAFDRRVR
jgi:hypothetical protein